MSNNNVISYQGYVPQSPASIGGGSITYMNVGTSIVKIASALNKAQKNIGGAAKGAANPFFKSKYADLGSVMEACKEALNEQGITVLQPVVSDTTGDYVETMLLHESGEYLVSRMKLIVNKQNMQELGSAISYARRYGLQSMVFIPAEDDDGEKSMARTGYMKSETKSTPVATVTTTSSIASTNTTTVASTPDMALKATEALPAGAVQSAVVEPLKKSSFRKPKKTEATDVPTKANAEDSGWN